VIASDSAASPVSPTLAVSPDELSRVAATLTDAASGSPAVPGTVVDAPWAVGVALPVVVAATADRLAELSTDARLAADAVRDAARSYRRCDEDAAERIRAALRGRQV
jgi:hypothetical protein